jgi:hypothetical protein
MIYKRGRIWWLRFKHHGRRYDFSLKTPERDEAEVKATSYKEMRVASKAMDKARDKAILHGLIPGGQAFIWAAIRWNKMNPRERLAAVFSAHEGRCAYCSRDVHIPLSRTKRIPPNRAVIDHRIPLISGGADSFDNVILSCNVCNLRKHEGTMEVHRCAPTC